MLVISGEQILESIAFPSERPHVDFQLFVVEMFRGDDRGFYALGMSISQWTGLLLVAALAAWTLLGRGPLRPVSAAKGSGPGARRGR